MFFFGRALSYIFYPLTIPATMMVLCCGKMCGYGIGWLPAYVVSFFLLLVWWPIWLLLAAVSLVLVGCGCSCIARSYDDESLLDDDTLFSDMVLMPYMLIVIPFLGQRD